MPVTYVDIVDDNDVGQRIDNYLLRVLKGVPRQHVYRVLRKGEVRVNGGRIRSSYRLKRNDRLRIPPVRTRQEMPVEYSPAAERQLRAATIYEDEEYLVLDKPAGMAVHGGSSIRSGVVEILRDALSLLDPSSRPGNLGMPGAGQEPRSAAGSPECVQAASRQEDL